MSLAEKLRHLAEKLRGGDFNEASVALVRKLGGVVEALAVGVAEAKAEEEKTARAAESKAEAEAKAKEASPDCPPVKSGAKTAKAHCSGHRWCGAAEFDTR